MEIKYLRNLGGSRMVIKQMTQEIAWEQEMLLRNPIEELLVPDCVSENGEETLWYDITGRQALDVVLDTQELDNELLRKICLTLVSVAEKLEGLLLSPDTILLKPECIFMDHQEEHICLCYYPGNQVELGVAFHELMQYLLKKLKHKDMAAVENAYRLFEETALEGYSVLEIPRLLSARDVREETVEEIPEVISAVPRETMKSEKTVKPKKIRMKEEKIKQPIEERIRNWIDRKKQEIFSYLPQKKEKQEEAFIFLPEEEEKVKPSRPTVLLSEISHQPQGILKYEGDGCGSDIKIEKLPYIIGSDAACDGQIGSDTVSRRHAKITRAEDIYFIEDLNSSNGTFVGGELLNCRVKMSLQCNETVVFADQKYRFL